MILLAITITPRFPSSRPLPQLRTSVADVSPKQTNRRCLRPAIRRDNSRGGKSRRETKNLSEGLRGGPPVGSEAREGGRKASRKFQRLWVRPLTIQILLQREFESAAWEAPIRAERTSGILPKAFRWRGSESGSSKIPATKLGLALSGFSEGKTTGIEDMGRRTERFALCRWYGMRLCLRLRIGGGRFLARNPSCDLLFRVAREILKRNPDLFLRRVQPCTRPTVSIAFSMPCSRKFRANSISAFSFAAACRDAPPALRLTRMPPLPGPSAT